MSKVSTHKVMIHKSIRDSMRDYVARNVYNKRQHDSFYVGYLGEIVAAAYLGVEWNDPGYSQRDLVDEYGTRYQVKTVREGLNKRKLWCEKAANEGFDRYIFVVLDENDEFGEVVGDMSKSLVDANSHDFNHRGEKLPCLNRVL